MFYLKGKLSDEEADALMELVSSEGFSVLSNKVLPMLIKLRADRVLTHTIDGQDLSKEQLVLLKAEFDGASKLAKDVSELKVGLRKPSAPHKT